VAFTLLLSAYTTPGSDSTISYVVAANCVHSVGAVAEADRSSRHKFAPEGCQDACYGKVKTWCRETRGEISTYYYLHSRQTESKLCDRLSQVDLLFFSIIHIWVPHLMPCIDTLRQCESKEESGKEWHFVWVNNVRETGKLGASPDGP